MTAGRNALRGSGPGQKPASDNALAQVGCPAAMGQKFFISFNSADRSKAHWIAWTLKEAGHKVAVHDWESPAGRQSHPRSPNAERSTPGGAYHPAEP